MMCDVCDLRKDFISSRKKSNYILFLNYPIPKYNNPHFLSGLPKYIKFYLIVNFQFCIFNRKHRHSVLCNYIYKVSTQWYLCMCLKEIRTDISSRPEFKQNALNLMFKILLCRSCTFMFRWMKLTLSNQWTICYF